MEKSSSLAVDKSIDLKRRYETKRSVQTTLSFRNSRVGKRANDSITAIVNCEWKTVQDLIMDYIDVIIES